ncbi:hypothetical protein [Mycobacterium sp. IS-1742]|uniref:hypothetical protein n=1 Tax=Mycobacterium sp. IS-1742 TaxID=1772285 RepID=UPI000AEBE7F4|nr:hypothetical protein [Mycobacterium sp. IS-1742]
MDSNFVFTGVAVAGIARTLRTVAPIPVAAPAGIPAHAAAMRAAIPAQRKRRAATAATRSPWNGVPPR